MSIKLYANISKIYTLSGEVRKGRELNNPMILENAWILVDGEKIIELGTGKCKLNYDKLIDLQGMVVIPGLIDSHTHLVFSGDRSNEYSAKIAGESYLEILQKGGGISSTTNATRLAKLDDLVNKTNNTLSKYLSNGITTLEAKSGYGLDLETEIKQLEVIEVLNNIQPIECLSTYMGAHSLPKEYDDRDKYLDYCIKEVMPLARKKAEFCDVFLEEGVFDYQQAKKYLNAAKQLGFKLKLHIDEMVNLQGSELACELEVTSVEHCMVTTPSQAESLGKNNIPMILLPMTSFNLNKDYAKARDFIDSGAILGLGSDYNPGSCPCDDFILTMRVASRAYRLFPNEILAMSTINNAFALGRDKIIGSLEKNKQADFVVLDCDNFDQVIARLDFNPVTKVIKKGEIVYDIN